MPAQALNKLKPPTSAYRRALGPQTSNFVGEQGIPEDIGRVSISSRTTGTFLFSGVDQGSIDARTAKNQITSTLVRTPLSPSYRVDRVEHDTSPLQIWEGRVLTVDRQSGTMEVLLNAKMGNIPEHTGEIELQWVADQDADLVRPGAVFYLTLYRRLRHGSIENSQELRFRRRPNWTRRQIDLIQENATRLLTKMKVRPTAE